MRTVHLYLVPLLLAAVFAAGCGTTPKARLKAATETYATAVDIVTDYAEAGYLDVDEVKEIEQYRRFARRNLNRWQAAVSRGSSGSEYEEEVQENLRDLGEAISEAKED
jgi:hypothetical protein